MSMTASEVAAYLEAHPEFLTNTASCSPRCAYHARSEYAVPLVERQALALRDKTASSAPNEPVDPLWRTQRPDHHHPVYAVGATECAPKRPPTPSAAHRVRWKDFDITHAGLRLWGTATGIVG